MSLLNYLTALMGSDQTTMRGQRPRSKRSLRLEMLENRRVFDASFDSLLTVGNDTASILPWDNAVDAAGNSYVAGAIYGSMDLDPLVDRPDGSDILTPRGTSDGFVAKYGPNMEFLWARRMGGDFVLTNGNDPIEALRQVTVDGAGNVFVTGNFVGSADFGSTQLTSVGNADAFVSKLDTNGNFLWSRSWGTSSREWGYDVTVDSFGNAIAVGATSVLATNGAWAHTGANIRKYDANGGLTWAKSLSATGLNATSVTNDTTGSIYVSGSFAGTVDLNPDTKKSNTVSGSTMMSGGTGHNAYLLKLSSTGTYVAAAPLVANTASNVNSRASIAELAIHPDGSLILGGLLVGTVDVNPSTTASYSPANVPASSSVGFVEKLSTSFQFAWSSLVAGQAVNDLAVDATGVYTVGQFSGTTNFAGMNYTSQGASDVIVNSVSNLGANNWVVTFGGSGSDLGNGIAIDAGGTLGIVGTYRSTVDFNPDAALAEERTNDFFSDLYLLKLRTRS